METAEHLPGSDEPLSEEDWIKRELAKVPASHHTEAWKAETRRLWGYKSVSPDDLNAGAVEAGTGAGLVDDNRADVAP